MFIYEDLAEFTENWTPTVKTLSVTSAYVSAVCVAGLAAQRWSWRHSDGSTLSDAEWDEVDNLVSQSIQELMAGMTEIQANDYGLVGSVWQPSPVRFGASAMVLVSSLNTLSAGSNNILVYTSPTNTVSVITNLAVSYDGVKDTLVLRLASGGVQYPIWEMTRGIVVAGYYQTVQGWWVLTAGVALRLVVTGAEAGDLANVYLSGFSYPVG